MRNVNIYQIFPSRESVTNLVYDLFRRTMSCLVEVLTNAAPNAQGKNAYNHTKREFCDN